MRSNQVKNASQNHTSEKLMHGYFILAASVSILCVFLICAFLFINGFSTMFQVGIIKFLTGTIWKPLNDIFGIFPFIVGSIYVTLIAFIVGVPIGILCAVYLVYFCPKKIYSTLKSLIDLLAGIPSIVYGFFGLVCLVPIMRELFGGSGKSILTGGILLGIMILPTIISVTESSLRAIDKSYYEGALALGATHERSVFFTCIPAAKSGIMAGIVLGVGRAIGETMAINFVVGNQPIIPTSLTQGARTLTTNIVLEMGYATDMHRQVLIATAVVLFIFILLINLVFNLIKRRIR